MIDPYENIGGWTRERLEEELEYLHLDKTSGTMTEDMYRDCYAIVLDEILKRDDDEDRKDAYNRAMRGI